MFINRDTKHRLRLQAARKLNKKLDKGEFVDILDAEAVEIWKVQDNKIQLEVRIVDKDTFNKWKQTL